MDDTPQHIKDLQLRLWLSKPPGERLRQFLIDNEEMFRFWKTAKEQLEIKEPSEKPDRPK